MLRIVFVRNASEGNCLALEPVFAGVCSSVSNWERDGVSRSADSIQCRDVAALDQALLCVPPHAVPASV